MTSDECKESDLFSLCFTRHSSFVTRHSLNSSDPSDLHIKKYQLIAKFSEHSGALLPMFNLGELTFCQPESIIYRYPKNMITFLQALHREGRPNDC